MDLINLKVVFYLLSVLFIVLPCEGCYTNYNNCMQLYYAAHNDSSTTLLDLYSICSLLNTTKICLENDAADCVEGTAEPLSYAMNKVSVDNLYNLTCFNHESIGSDCVKKRVECRNLSSESFDSSTSDLKKFTSTICRASTKVETCYSELRSICVDTKYENETNPLELFQKQICLNESGIFGNDSGCAQKVIECGELAPGIGTIIRPQDITDLSALQGLSSTICPVVPKLQICYSELDVMCPNYMAEKVTNFLDVVKTQICGNDSGGGETTSDNSALPVIFSSVLIFVSLATILL